MVKGELLHKKCYRTGLKIESLPHKKCYRRKGHDYGEIIDGALLREDTSKI